MASPAVPLPSGEVVPPAADPEAIRACLSPSLVAEFDREWEIVLEQAKRDKTLGPVHEMLIEWRHTAYLEMKDPGAYYRLLAKAEQIMRTGGNPEAGSFDDMKALIQQRLGRQV